MASGPDPLQELTVSTEYKSATPPPAGVARAFEPKNVPRIRDFGLGRGLDGTSPTPWLNKTPFPVRRVHFDDLIGTEESGAIQIYSNEIESVSLQHVKMKSSVTIPQSPVSIGVDDEMSRSATSLRVSVGKKIVNRAISYREDMHDALINRVSDKAEVGELQSSLGLEDMPSFQERAAKWICDRLEKPANPNVAAMEQLKEIIQKGKKDRDIIIDLCREFVTEFRITHYVSEIQLGAAQYVVMSHQQFQTTLATSANLGIEQIASASLGGGSTSNRSANTKNVKKIGHINPDDTVTRWSDGEAVVGFKMQPISRLINNRFLKLAVQLALVEFFERETDNTDGPFIIACRNRNLFLTVNPENNAVMATDDCKKAAHFYIIQDEDQHKMNEFLIGYYRDNKRQKGHIAYFLEAPVSFFGFNNGPLHVKQTVKEEKCQFVLHNRLIKDSSPAVSVSNWIAKNEVCYINCSRRKYARDGYLAVKRHEEPMDTITYMTACYPSMSYHNDDDTYMLFELIRPTETPQHVQLTESHSQHVQDILAKLSELYPI